MSILHVTHGEMANRQLTDAQVPGDRLGWDDVLHEGPVPADLNIEALSDLRARFIAEQGWGAESDVRRRFHQRNRRLGNAARDGEVVVWSTFELYDQLHLLQVLDWYDQHDAVLDPPCVIWLSGYFAEQPMVELMAWFHSREPVGNDVVSEAARLWALFRRPDPSALAAWTRRNSPGLPFMHSAMERLLQEYPDASNGLSRTAQQVLTLLMEGEQGPLALFRGNQQMEEAAFMGDWSFWRVLDGLVNAHHPAVTVTGRPAFVHPPGIAADAPRFADQRLRLTAVGEDLLVGKADFVHLNGLDRWIGGVHLRPDNDWRWGDGHVSLKARGRQ